MSFFSRIKYKEFIKLSKVLLLISVLNIINIAINLYSIGILKYIVFILNNIL